MLEKDRDKILIITNRKLSSAPRVIREINALKSHFEIVVYGTGELKDNDVRACDFSRELKVSFVDKVLRKLILYTKGKSFVYMLPFVFLKLKRILQKENPAIVIVHEPEWLPYLKKLKGKFNFKIVFNAHEYHPLEHEGNVSWLKTSGVYYNKIYRNCLQTVDLMINVCNTISEECKRVFRKESIVIPNAAFYFPEIKCKPIGQLPFRIIHHGVTNRDRKLELMINAVAKLPDKCTLDLMLVKENDPDYYTELEQLAMRTPNVKIKEPVKFNEIIPVISQYDVGLYFIYPTSFNNKAALPNKFFEYIQARLCIVVSPSVEMKNIVNANNLGVVGNGFAEEDIVNALSGLTTDQINEFKLNADKSAYALSVEKFNELLLSEVNKLKY